MNFNVNTKMKHVFLYTGLLLLAQSIWAQSQKDSPDLSRNTGKAFLFHFNLGTHLPVGDLSKRFGQDMSIGGGTEIISANNVIYGLTGHYFFGQNVKEDPIAGFRTPDGDIIGSDQALATIAYANAACISVPMWANSLCATNTSVPAYASQAAPAGCSIKSGFKMIPAQRYNSMANTSRDTIGLPAVFACSNL